MKKIIVFCLLLSSQAFAQIDSILSYLRQAPASISGSISFDRDTTLMDSGWTSVKLLKDEEIHFIIAEDRLEVYPNNALMIRSHLAKVKVKSILWKAYEGVESRSELPIDITGISREAISKEVADVIEETFGKKLIEANHLLKTIRYQETTGSVVTIVNTIISLFKPESVRTSSSRAPSFRGKFSLNFHPSKKQILHINNHRISIKDGDAISAEVMFTGAANGKLRPETFHISSRLGIDINKGHEWKSLARLVLKDIELNSQGTSIDLHLGATEVVLDLVTVAEILRRSNNPGARCNCTDFTIFPTLRVTVEKSVRQAIFNLASELTSSFRKMNVPNPIVASFLRKERCNLNGLTCMEECHSINSEGEKKLCANRCQVTLRSCLR